MKDEMTELDKRVAIARAEIREHDRGNRAYLLIVVATVAIVVGALLLWPQH